MHPFATMEVFIDCYGSEWIQVAQKEIPLADFDFLEFVVAPTFRWDRDHPAAATAVHALRAFATDLSAASISSLTRPPVLHLATFEVERLFVYIAHILTLCEELRPL